MIWVAIFMELLLLAAAIWLYVIIIKLYLNKEYRECPPYVPSFGAEKKVIFERVSAKLAASKEKLTILDPGCGTGTLIIDLAKRFPNHCFVGIEWGKPAYLIAKRKASKLKNVTLLQQDMFTYSFAKADIIVCFLMQPLMERFGKKLLSDCREKETTVYSNTFYIPNLKPVEKISTEKSSFIKKFALIKNVYVYKLPQ